ncbi:hypothetical protein M0R45_001174 [Rubus argutus]|uniref:Uncharacterized protein n=1 Tax=Rubus argutus TaxID=59490 RepID=A0AAW1VKS0_RUBAR
MDERPALRNAVTGSKRWQAGMTESFSRSLHLQVPFCIIYTSPILVLWKSTTRRSLDLKLKNLDLIGIEMVMIAITALILLFLSRLVPGPS